MTIRNTVIVALLASTGSMMAALTGEPAAVVTMARVAGYARTRGLAELPDGRGGLNVDPSSIPTL